MGKVKASKNLIFNTVETIRRSDIHKMRIADLKQCLFFVMDRYYAMKMNNTQLMGKVSELEGKLKVTEVALQREMVKEDEGTEDYIDCVVRYANRSYKVEGAKSCKMIYVLFKNEWTLDDVKYLAGKLNRTVSSVDKDKFDFHRERGHTAIYMTEL